MNGIYNESVDGLIVKINTNNTISNSNIGFNGSNLPLFLRANTTITGPGSLTTENLPVWIYGSTLTIKDCGLFTLKGRMAALRGNDSGNDFLVVDNSNVTVETKDVYYFAGEPTAVYDMQGRRYDSQRKGLSIMRMTDGSVRKVNRR